MDLFRSDLAAPPLRGNILIVRFPLICIAGRVQRPETALADNPAYILLFVVLATTTKVNPPPSDSTLWRLHNISLVLLCRFPVDHF